MKKLLLCGVWLFAMAQIFAGQASSDVELDKKIKSLESQTDKIIVFRTGETNPARVELSGSDLKEFFSLLKLKLPVKSYSCRCFGQLKLEFYTQDRKTASLTYHHAASFRGLDIPTDIEIAREFRKPMKAFFLKHGFNQLD